MRQERYDNEKSIKIKRRMKKLLILAIAIISTSFFITIASAQSSEIRTQLEVLYKTINIFVDGEKIESTDDSFVIVDQGRVMVPLRTVSEALGVGVDWDEKDGRVILTTPRLEAASHSISQLSVLRNVGPFYLSTDQRVSIAQRQFSSGLLVDNQGTSRAEFVVKLDQQYKGFETYVGVEDHTQNSSSNFIVSFYADDRLIDSPALRINEDNPVKPAHYARWIKFDGLENAKRLTVRVEFIGSEDGIGDYRDLTAAFANFNLILR
ncbi:stalk domain-containing protein [Desulfuribacillus alkaliarsenatis]|uniref:Copper amine oxidase-like N-terminal domain-containing protein n=1 Tax=Desulfuribacillus alkaliarsenatis TaxID=766136 RepID=A0A1E5G582_9FIRM|nr:stalk domain-containing protein [Desulfuribacillus alkaliarsenatis]OEF98328.1 hypothetical protein BHF68_01210 [Desulfuribacillus alkaliarsenatis]